AAIVLVAVTTVLWLALPIGNRVAKTALTATALVLPTIPLSMMLMALVPADTQAGSWIQQAVLLGALVAGALLAGRKPVRAFALISGAFATLVVVDLATGANLCRFSVMGHSVVDGSRYYGIGNEYMGAFVGAGVTLVGLFIGWPRVGHRMRQVVAIIALVTAAVVLGAPGLGANTGGLIAGGTAFAVVLACTFGTPIKVWRIAAFAIVLAAVLALFGILDALRGQGNESHLGKAVGLALSGGLGETGIIIKRKLAMNLTLIKVSVWSRLLLAYVLSAILILQRRDVPARFGTLPSGARVAAYGVLGGTLAALIFNDSGVVAASTCFVYAWALLALKVSDEQSTASARG
ncbi:MAG: hypothetical protein JXQ75_12515, partial [Phycisphaerae bacterium]|nr:hypothetical protein [Phycisphaerae bacterium]